MDFITSCVGAQGDDIIDMTDISRDLTAEQFASYVDYPEVERMLGYIEGEDLTLANDWAVSFHASYYQSKPCVYVRHSAIEYVYQ